MNVRQSTSLTLAPALLWLALVTLFSLSPDTPHVPGVSDDLLAVTGHFLMYAGLSALLYRWHMTAMAGKRRRPVYSALFAIVTAAGIGLVFEWAQVAFTETRSFQREDIVANTFGAVAAASALFLLEVSGSSLAFVAPVVIASGVALIALAGVSYAVWDPDLPYRGDHWHARLTVMICGEALPHFPPGPGNVHTHGDGYIHIHPQSSRDEGRNASLGAFFRSSGGNLTDSSITLPSGQTYSNGDLCPDGDQGTVSVARRESGTYTPVGDIAGYVPRNREWLVVEFGSARGSVLQAAKPE